MASLELTFTRVNIPTGTSASVTIYEDVGNDGTGGSTDPNGKPYDNAATVSLSDATTTYTISGFDVHDTNAYWFETTLDNTDNTVTAEVEFPVSIDSVPQSPTGLTATQGAEDQINLSWTSQSGGSESGFRVYRAQASGASRADYTQVADLASGTTTYTDTTLEDGEQYYYRVVAYNASTESFLSNEDSAVTVLPSPSGTSVSASAEDQLTVSWTRNDDSSDGTWEVYRSTSSGSLGARIYQSATLTDTSITDTGLPDGERFYYTVRRVTNHASADGAQVSGVTLLPAPTLDTINVSGDQFSVNWFDNSDNEDGFRVQLRQSGTSSWTTDRDVAADSTQAWTSSLLDGEKYDVRVVAYTEDATAASSVSTATTELPDVSAPTLGNGVEDEISVDWNDVIDNGHYDIQYRETGATTWLNEPEQAQSDTSHVITGLEDGEEYEVRMRTQTEHVAGAWTSPVSITTKFPGVTGLTVKSTSADSVTLEATDNADNEDGIEVWRADEKDPARPTGFTSFQQVADIGPFAGTGTFTYTDSGLDPNHDYQYYLVPYTEHSSAQTGTVTGTTAIDYATEWTLELRRADGEKLAIDGEDLIQESIRYRRKPSAISSWQASIPRTPVLEDWIDSEAYWWYNGSLVLRGPLHRHDGYEDLQGKGLLWHLKQGGTSRRFQSIEGWKAARDYIDQETPFTAVATQPSANIIDQDKVVQDADTTSELQTVHSPPANVPVVSKNGTTVLATTCFTREAEDYTRRSGAGLIGRTGFSGGGSPGAGLELNSLGDYAEYDITLDYAMPASAVRAAFRHYSSSDNPEITVSIDGTALYTYPAGVGPGAISFSQNNGSWSGGDLAAGTHTIRFENTASNTGTFELDVVATPYDNRYTYNFDNSIDANGYLSGPETKPSGVTFESVMHDDTYNITAATLTTTISDVSGKQSLQLSNDQGANWYPSDGTETNTQSIDITDFPTVGTDIKARVTLDRYGSRTDATPTQGFLGQAIDTWTLDVTTNSLGVIDDRTYTGNHFENLKSICDDAGVVFTGTMADGTLEIEVFATGDKTGTLTLDDTDVLNHNRVLDREQYANIQTVAGQASDGSLITATARSQTEISKHGEVEGPWVVEKRLSSKSDVENQAAQLLAQRIASRDITGHLDLLPEYGAQVTPGYQYTLDYGDFSNDDLILHSIQYNDLRNTVLDFEDAQDIARVLAGLGGELKQTKDAI